MLWLLSNFRINVMIWLANKFATWDRGIVVFLQGQHQSPTLSAYFKFSPSVACLFPYPWAGITLCNLPWMCPTLTLSVLYDTYQNWRWWLGLLPWDNHECKAIKPSQPQEMYHSKHSFGKHIHLYYLKKETSCTWCMHRTYLWKQSLELVSFHMPKLWQCKFHAWCHPWAYSNCLSLNL